LSKEEKEELKQKLRSKSKWLTSEVRALIKKEFGADYSARHVRKIFRGFKMHYAKSYPRDYRRPENATAKNITDECIIGFLDRAAPQTTDNSLTFLVV